MAFDLEAIKRRMAQLSGKNFGSQWKPKPPSEHYVRIIALPNNDGEPCATRMFYYDISKFPIIAPYQFGKPDPFQELINKLREDGSPESRELAKKTALVPVSEYAAPAVKGQTLTVTDGPNVKLAQMLIEASIQLTDDETLRAILIAAAAVLQ